MEACFHRGIEIKQNTFYITIISHNSEGENDLSYTFITNNRDINNSAIPTRKGWTVRHKLTIEKKTDRIVKKTTTNIFCGRNKLRIQRK